MAAIKQDVCTRIIIILVVKVQRINRKKLDGLIRAALAHLYFVAIHPFDDGNGRLARALSDLALAQDEGTGQRFYSLSAQIMKERREYYRKLEEAQKNDGDCTDWLLWFFGCLKRAIGGTEPILLGRLIAISKVTQHRLTLFVD